MTFDVVVKRVGFFFYVFLFQGVYHRDEVQHGHYGPPA